MNILLDRLPTKVEIGGMEFEINSGFRTSILFTQLLEDSDVPDNFKIVQSLELYYGDCARNIKNIQEAYEKIMWFYTLGKTSKKSESNSGEKVTKDYDFEYDAELIYAAFMQNYHIDLSESNMHWWKFITLLNCIEGTLFGKVREIRNIDTSKLKGDQAREIKELKKKVAVKTQEDVKAEEEAREIEEILMYGRSKSGKTLADLK